MSDSDSDSNSNSNSNSNSFAGSPFTINQVELASRNYRLQERLLEDLRAAASMSGIGASELATELEISGAEASDWLEGETDLTLSQLRHFANAIDACVQYTVRPLHNTFEVKWRNMQPRLADGLPTWSQAPKWETLPHGQAARPLSGKP